MVVGKDGSMYGSVKPLDGEVHFNLESCGQQAIAKEDQATFFSFLFFTRFTSLLSLVDKAAQSSWSDPAIGSISSRIEQKT